MLSVGSSPISRSSAICRSSAATCFSKSRKAVIGRALSGRRLQVNVLSDRHLCKRVPIVDELHQAAAVDMRVDFGRGDIGMAQHQLQRAQIGAPFEKMSGKGVTQYMRAHA